MTATIVIKTNDEVLIKWSDKNTGFGQLSMKYDAKSRDFIIDSECMGIDFILEVFKAL